MKQTFTDLRAFLDHGYDSLIDVRSPAEYAEDHIPGAVNLPVLSNAERAEIGRIYTQESPFLARKRGAALVARNAATHLLGPLSGKEGAWRPLVYCWRGGQRSGSFATILSQVGWRVGLVEGGYQSWRRQAHDFLYNQTFAEKVVLLDGLTGTAKTDILHAAAGMGAQVLDLEGMANHRGSLLGARSGGQPSQKHFETRLAAALARLDPARPVLIEAESNKIGECHIPPALWEAMKSAPALIIDAPIEARAAYLARAYCDLIDDPAQLAARLEGIRALRGADIYQGWLNLMNMRDYNGLSRALMEQHYDPAYRKSRAQRARPVIATLHSERLDASAQARLAVEIVGRIKEI